MPSLQLARDKEVKTTMKGGLSKRFSGGVAAVKSCWEVSGDTKEDSELFI